MKVCSKCGLSKPKSEFSKNKRAKDGLCYSCKSCQKEYERSYRLNNPNKPVEYRKTHTEKLKKYQREKYKEHQEFIDSLKTPCVKCGEERKHIIQFHHIDPSRKKFEITLRHSKESILDEVKKCVCLCSNCHDEYHYFYGKKPEDPVESLITYLGTGTYKVMV